MGRRAASVIFAFATGVAQCGQIAPSTHATPPPDTGQPCPGTFDLKTFAIDSLDFGERTTDGWASIGYDLDGKITGASSTDVCAQAAGAPRANQVDGNDGIDNAFGHLIAPGLASVLGVTALSDSLTAAIRAGRFTIQLQIAGLGTDPAQNCTGLKGQVFPSDTYDVGGATPTFDSSTNWPVLASSLNDGATIASGAKAAFSGAYVTHGTFVTLGASSALPLRITLAGVSLELLVHTPVVTFDHVDDADAANGVLAGVLDPIELGRALESAALQSGQQQLCDGGGNGLLSQIEQAADILADRTNTAGVTCDHVSFAVGFHAKKISNPTKVAPPLPAPPTCP